MGPVGEVVRRTVLGDVLLQLALAASVDQLQHLVADELEGVAVRPAGTVVIPAGLGRTINPRRVDGVALGTDVPDIIDVPLLLGAVEAGGGGEEAGEGCDQQAPHRKLERNTALVGNLTVCNLRLNLLKNFRVNLRQERRGDLIYCLGLEKLYLHVPN